MPTEIAMKPVVYQIRGMERAIVRQRVDYAPGLTMDIYYPANHTGEALPTIIYALGYRDAGVPTPFGYQFRETRMCISWSQLFAASGMIGVVYETSDPAKDLTILIAHLRANAAALNIDPNHIGLYASSGNVPVALSAIMNASLPFAVLCYGFMLDLDGSTAVAESAKQFYFANPCAGRTVDDLPLDTSLLIVRAGKEQFPGLNDSIDTFVCHATRRNLPITVINHAKAPHAFDLFDDTGASRSVIRAILAFLQSCLNSM